MKTIKVDSECTKRLDQYLTDNTDFSRSRIQKMLKDKDILVNGKAVKSSYTLKLNDEITINEKEIEPSQIPFTAEQLAHLVMIIDKGTISSSIGKKVIEELFENPREPEDIVKEKGWAQISDESAIKEVVIQILNANPQSVADFKAGKEKALGFLVGQAMKTTKGKANPQLLNKLFIEELKK